MGGGCFLAHMQDIQKGLTFFFILGVKDGSQGRSSMVTHSSEVVRFGRGWWYEISEFLSGLYNEDGGEGELGPEVSLMQEVVPVCDLAGGIGGRTGRLED